MISKTDMEHTCHRNHTNQCRITAGVTQLSTEQLNCFSSIIQWQGEKKWDRDCSRLRESQGTQQPNATHEETYFVSWFSCSNSENGLGIRSTSGMTAHCVRWDKWYCRHVRKLKYFSEMV